jgi:hypothetical protein
MSEAKAACENCAWWKTDQGRHVGECRKRPPKSSYTWPYTNNADWCGEHKEKPTNG